MKRVSGLKGKLLNLSVSPTGKQVLKVELDGDFTQRYDDLKDFPVTVEVKRWRRDRSLDANAYFWLLADRLAAEMGISKEEVYRTQIRQIGGVSTTVCVKSEAVDQLCEVWKNNGIGWQSETFDSKIPGCTNVILYYGSSTYDTKQMSALIEKTVQDCQAVGIETKTPEEIQSLLDQWGG